jgi:integrase
VNDAVQALLKTMRDDGLAEGTIETNEHRLNAFFDLPVNAARPIRWIARRGEELYDKLRAKHKAADTHQAELALAKRVGALCVKRKWLRENPFEDVENVGRKRHGATKARLRVDESRKLLEYCRSLAGDPWATLTVGYLLLGSRASELVRRDVRDIDDDGRLLWIDRSKTEAGSRRLAIPDELRGMLLELVRDKKPSDPIFTKEDGSKATRYAAYYHVKRISKAAGVTELSPQGMRRTQTDMATEAGETAIAVARHLGQTSPRVTDRSYRDKNVAADARVERGLKLIAGGKR